MVKREIIEIISIGIQDTRYNTIEELDMFFLKYITLVVLLLYFVFLAVLSQVGRVAKVRL